MHCTVSLSVRFLAVELDRTCVTYELCNVYFYFKVRVSVEKLSNATECLRGPLLPQL